MQKRLILATLLTTPLFGCGGGGTATPTPAPTTISLSAPVTQALAGGKPLTLAASSSSSEPVTWQLAPAAPGSLSTSAGGAQYTPPATVSSNTSVTITASAGSASRTITVTVYPEPGAAGLSLIAGTLGGRGLIDGSGSAARLSKVGNMAGASDGTMYFSDEIISGSDNERRYALRSMSPAGAVTTLLQTIDGFTDGNRSQARISHVPALAPAADGSLWFIDYGKLGYHFRKLGTDGSVNTISSALALSDVKHMVAGRDGNLYVLAGVAVMRLSPSGALSTLAGQPGASGDALDGTGTAARFYDPRDLTIDRNGDLFVVDAAAVRKIDMRGTVSTVAGQIGTLYQDALDGNGSAARFSNPSSLDAAADGSLLVLDSQSSGPVLRKVSAAGAVSTLYRGSNPPQRLPFELRSAARLVRVSASAPVLVVREGQVDQLSGGTLLPLAGLEDDSDTERDGVGAAARFMGPSQLAADRAGNLYVADDITNYGGHVVAMEGLSLRKIAADGTVSTLVAADRSFAQVAGMAVDGNGSLYMVEKAPSGILRNPYGGAVYRIGSDGKRTLLAGISPNAEAHSGAVLDGQGGAARFGAPRLAGIDGEGNLYLNDHDSVQNKDLVRKVTPTGLVSTVAAVPADVGTAWDGARYGSDGLASVYRLAADGSKLTIAGIPGMRGTVLGALPGGLDRPLAIVPTGPYSFAVTSGSAILKLVLPH
jgi:hypothetical protein